MSIVTKKWLEDNELLVKEQLPKEWVKLKEIKILPFSFHLKTLGLNWTSVKEFGDIMTALEKFKVIERKKDMVRANPENLYTVIH